MSESDPNKQTPGVPRPDEPAAKGEAVPAKPDEPQASAFEGLLGSLFSGQEGDGKGGKHRKRKAGGEMGLLDHLEELRSTVLKSIGAIFAGMLLVAGLIFPFFHLLNYPLEMAFGPEKAKAVLMAPLQPMGGVTMAMQGTVFGGFLLALPLVAYFIIKFVMPGLNMREKGMLRPVLISAVALFMLGVLSCYFIMLPAGLRFGDWFDRKLGAGETRWTMDTYYSLLIWSTLGMGALFEFPLVLVILQVLGVVETGTLRHYWRHAIIGILFVSSFVAPSPDPGTMLIIAVPMYLLYEASMVVGAILRRKRVAKQAAADAADAASADVHL